MNFRWSNQLACFAGLVALVIPCALFYRELTREKSSAHMDLRLDPPPALIPTELEVPRLSPWREDPGFPVRPAAGSPPVSGKE